MGIPKLIHRPSSDPLKPCNFKASVLNLQALLDRIAYTQNDLGIPRCNFEEVQKELHRFVLRGELQVVVHDHGNVADTR